MYVTEFELYIIIPRVNISNKLHTNFHQVYKNIIKENKRKKGANTLGRQQQVVERKEKKEKLSTIIP